VRGGAGILSTLLLLAAGCTTDVVDFTLKKASLADAAPLTCKMVEGAKYTRCQYCSQPGTDASVKGPCYKLGCVPFSSNTECKECWWGDTPKNLCYICSNKSGVYKDTCSSTGSTKKKDAG